jgi:hypothetical protein
MPKALRKLCLLSVMAFAVIFSVLFTPRTASAAREACQVMHFGCDPELIDCCCGFTAFCAWSLSQCDSVCGPIG